MVNDARLQSASRRALLPAAVIACALAISLQAFHAKWAYFNDDSYITLRYARNLLAGHGAVFNPGEHVQGYTNTLQVGLVWLLGTAGVDLYVAARLVGIGSYVLLALGVCWLQWRYFQPDPLRLLPVVLTLTSYPLVVWSLGGLESVLFSLLVAAGSVLFLAGLQTGQPLPHQPMTGPSSDSSLHCHTVTLPHCHLFAAAAVCFSLAYLARPDGIVFVAICLAWLLFSRGPHRWRHAVLFVTVCLAVVAPYLIWQYNFYGSLVPNTFHAKAGVPLALRLRNGLYYLFKWTVTPPFLPAMLPLLLGWMVCRRSLHRVKGVAVSQFSVLGPQSSLSLPFLLSLLLTYAAYVLFVGGDHMAAFRMMLPAVVPLIYGVYLLLRRLWPDPSPAAVGRVYAAALLLAVAQMIPVTLNPWGDPAAVYGRHVGLYIDKAWPAGSLVAVNPAGATPYHAPDLRFLDMLGLNDAHIARRWIDKPILERQQWPGHLKGDGAYVLSRKPDYIILGAGPGCRADEPLFLSDIEIARDPRFAAEYRMKTIDLVIDDESSPTREKMTMEFTYYQRIHSNSQVTE